MGILLPPVGWFSGFRRVPVPLSASNNVMVVLFCAKRPDGGRASIFATSPVSCCHNAPGIRKIPGMAGGSRKRRKVFGGGNLLLLPGREGERAVMSHTQSLFLLLLLLRRRVDNVVCVLRPASEAYFLPLFCTRWHAPFFPWREWHGIFHKIL